MRTVSQYIQTLLFEHDYVTVPNLGAFIANYQPASYNEISGSLMPPQKRIAFNEVLRQDDGLLAMQIARRENVSIEEAKKYIQNFVEEVKGRLFLDRYFSLDRIGNFSLNEENNLVFEPDRKANYYSESFGFDSLYPRRTEKEIQLYNTQVILEEATDDFEPAATYSYSKRSKKSKSLTYSLYALPVLFLSFGLLYILFSPKDNTKTEASKPSLSSINPMDYLPKDSQNIVNNKTQLPDNQIVIPPKEQKVTQEIIKPILKEQKSEVKKVEITEKLATEKPKEKATEIIKDTKPTLKIEEKPESLKIGENTTNLLATKKFKVIAGLFRSHENAENQKKHLFENGFENVQLIPKSSLYCVIAAETENAEEAKKIAQKVSKVIGETAIVQ